MIPVEFVNDLDTVEEEIRETEVPTVSQKDEGLSADGVSVYVSAGVTRLGPWDML